MAGSPPSTGSYRRVLDTDRDLGPGPPRSAGGGERQGQAERCARPPLPRAGAGVCRHGMGWSMAFERTVVGPGTSPAGGRGCRSCWRTGQPMCSPWKAAGGRSRQATTDLDLRHRGGNSHNLLRISCETGRPMNIAQASSAPSAGLSASTPGTSAGQGRKVLIVDDEDSITELVPRWHFATRASMSRRPAPVIEPWRCSTRSGPSACGPRRHAPRHRRVQRGRACPAGASRRAGALPRPAGTRPRTRSGASRSAATTM